MSNEELGGIVRIEAGSPTAAELAAVLAVLQAAQAAETSKKKLARKPKSTWTRNGNSMRSAISPGFGQWRSHYRPGLD
jgi:Acyl-CoA carboxylase epsilon subunit